MKNILTKDTERNEKFLGHQASLELTDYAHTNKLINTGNKSSLNDQLTSEKILNLRPVSTSSLIKLLLQSVVRYMMLLYHAIKSGIIIGLIIAYCMLQYVLEYTENNRAVVKKVIYLKDLQLSDQSNFYENQKKLDILQDFSFDLQTVDKSCEVMQFLKQKFNAQSHIESMNMDFKKNTLVLVVHSDNPDSLASYVADVAESPQFLSISNVEMSTIEPRYKYHSSSHTNTSLNNKSINYSESYGSGAKFSQQKFNQLLKQISNNNETDNRSVYQAPNDLNQQEENNIYECIISFDIKKNT